MPSFYQSLTLLLALSQSRSPQIDRRAEALLRRTEASWASAHSFQANIVDPGALGQTASVLRISRSGSYSLVDGGKAGSRSVLVSDGHRLLSCDEKGKSASLMDEESIYEMGNVVPTFFLITSFLEPGLWRQLEAPTYQGEVTRNGRKFQVVKSPQTAERGAWTLYFKPNGPLQGIESEAFHSGSTTVPAQRAWLAHMQLDKPVPAAEFAYSPAADIPVSPDDNPLRDLPALHSVAPDFSLPGIDGKTLTMDSLLKGKKALLLNITFAQCGACMLEIPALKRLHADLKDKGLAVLSVNILDNRQNALKVIAKYHITYPEGLDSSAGGGAEEFAKRYHAQLGGTSILIGPDKRIAWFEAGLNEKRLRCLLTRMGIPATPP